MPQQTWSAKRERQYEHIKEGEKKQGRSTKRAKEIAAATVNKERARKGEAKSASRSSTRDISSARRGKLTLFEAEGPRERGALKHIALRVSDLRAAIAELPQNLAVEQPREGEAYFDVYEGLRLGLVEGRTDVDYDLDHVALFSRDPTGAARAYERLGFRYAP